MAPSLCKELFSHLAVKILCFWRIWHGRKGTKLRFCRLNESLGAHSFYCGTTRLGRIVVWPTRWPAAVALLGSSDLAVEDFPSRFMSSACS